MPRWGGGGSRLGLLVRPELSLKACLCQGRREASVVLAMPLASLRVGHWVPLYRNPHWDNLS